MEMYQFNFCAVKNVSVSKYLRHMQSFHESEPNFSVKCKFGCPNIYIKISSYRVRIFRKHNKWTQPCQRNEAPDVAQEEHNYEEDCDELVQVDSFKEQLSHFTESIKRHFALFCLKLQEQHVVSRTAIHSVSNKVKSLIELFNEQYRDLLKNCVSELGIWADSHANLTLLLENDLFGKCFEHVVSDYQFERYCMTEFGLIEQLSTCVRI